ncbi:MAG: VWA domain-containing protein [Gammaproteobacteria bacterium]
MTMWRHFHFRATVTLLVLIGQAAFSATAWAAEPVPDVRILIDISGSMKHNDPHNLRAPALRLLTGLLPKGTRAGVWTYGQYINMLVPLGEVNAAWKKQAEQAAAKINSFGLFTNIEDAMRRATADWREPDKHSRRSLIMLTDGLVDVSKDPSLDAASRDRIINKILPRLRAAKVKINTIALSGEADHELLQQLASATDGWFEEVDNADRLQRIFLHMFEKATQPDTLPLEGNSVQVDNSIEEITFLVFRDLQGKPTRLMEPNHQQFGKENAPKQVRWHHDTGYDLITITKPRPGEWHILGPIDADNRVMVVTNLKVHATQLPNNLGVDDTPFYFAQLLQKGKLIRRKDFLDLVHVTLRDQLEGGRHREWQLHDDGEGADMAAGDGTFSNKLAASMKAGRHELTLLVDGTTFQREQRQIINVYAQPVQASVRSDPDQSGHFVLSVIPYAGLIDADSMQVTAVVTDNDGTSRNITLARTGPAEWRSELKDFNDPAGYQAVFHVTGTRPGGKPISTQLGAFKFNVSGVAPPARVAAPAPSASQRESKSAPAAPPDSEATADGGHAANAKTPASAPDAAPAAQEVHSDAVGVNWYLVIGQVVLINGLLIGGGFFVYRRWWRSDEQAGNIGLLDDDASPGEQQPLASILEETKAR